jgi:cytoskeletal protein RodZ
MSSPSVGTHLRRLREGRGMSLEEIARATRVSSGYLHALEADDFASLPAPVFTRGFIRAYCQSLGEAPETALGFYDARAEPTPAMADAAAPPPPRALSTRRMPVAAVLARNVGPLVVSFILLVVLGVALFAVTALLQSGRDRGTGRATVAPASTAGVPAPAPVPTPSTHPVDQSSAPPASVPAW